MPVQIRMVRKNGESMFSVESDGGEVWLIPLAMARSMVGRALDGKLEDK